MNQYLPAIMNSELEYWDSSAYDPDKGIRTLPSYSQDLRYLAQFSRWLHNTERVTVVKETTVTTKLAWIERLFPHFRYLFLFRRPDEVIASLLTGGFFETWSYRSKFEKHVRRFVTGTNVSFSDIEVLAHIWNWRAHLMIRFLEKRMHDIHLVDYNRLILQPQATLTELFTRFGLSVTDEVMSELHEKRQSTRGGLYSTYRGGEDTVAPRTLFDKDDMKVINDICAENYSRLLASSS